MYPETSITRLMASKNTTLEHYQRDMENHVKPYLGKKLLTQLTATDLRKLYDSLRRNGRAKPRHGQNHGLSISTIHGIHATLHLALKAAKEQGLIPVNPADEVDPPKATHSSMKILNEEQLETFMDVIQKDAVWHDFFYTELTTGLRRGEICGLMWSDFDEQNGVFKISRTLYREKGGRLVVGDTKTYAGTRKIILPPSTAQLLRDRKKKSFSPWIFHDPLHPEAPVNPSSTYRHKEISGECRTAQYLVPRFTSHLRDFSTPERSRCENGIRYVGALRRRVHPPYLHPRHPTDAG